MPIQYLGSWMSVETEVMNAMLDLADVGPGDKYIDLGCGDGQFVAAAALRGAAASGIEIDPVLVSNAIGIANIEQGDVFDADVSKMTVVSFWFTDTKLTPLLMDNLYAEMKKGAKLVCIYHSRTQYRDGVLVPGECLYSVPHVWQPTQSIEVNGNWIHLYIR